MEECKIYYQNVGGMKTKLEEFYVRSCTLDVQILCVTESWLNKSVKDSEIVDVNKYNIFRKDRCPETTGCSQGGGVFIAVEAEFGVKQLLLPERTVFDIVALKVRLGKINLYICGIYIPPQQTVECYENLYRIIDNVVQEARDTDRILLLGDLNLPNICKNVMGEKENLLLNMLSYHNLEQINIVQNSMGTILDLVCCRYETAVVEKQHIPILFENGYHPALLIRMKMDRIKLLRGNNNVVYNFCRGNYMQLFLDLKNVKWNECMTDTTDVNEMMGSFYKILYDKMDQSIPKIAKKKKKYPPWFTKSLITKINKKKRWLKNYRKTRCEEQKARIQELGNEISVEAVEQYKRYIHNAEQNLKSNPKDFWEFVKTKNCTKGVPDLMFHNGRSYKTGLEIVDGFAEYFESVYSRNPIHIPGKHDGYNVINYDINFDNITEEEIKTAVKKINGKSSAGLDNIPPYILKGCIDALVEPLKNIFNLACHNEAFPDALKRGKVCPIFKKGKAEMIENYRPVTLLSVFAKVLESVLERRIQQGTRHYCSDLQHGFTRGKTTSTNLAVFTQFVADHLEAQSQVDCLYLDFRKAFDRVDHSVLLRKLCEFGLSLKAVKFIASYLSVRENVVYCKGFESRSYIAASGIPQGSNLGPLLFKLFVDNLTRVCKWSKMLLFADDCKIYTSVSSVSDCQQLQGDLENVSKWCQDNRLELNIEKCACVIYSRKKVSINYEYKLENVRVLRCESIKDLGVTFDNKLTFNEHVQIICKKAYQLLGFVIRNTKNFTELQAIKCVYSSIVVPTLTYCDIIWSPIYYVHSNNIERVQKKFSRYLYFKEFGQYPDYDVRYINLCKFFNLINLYNIRKINAVLFLFKLLNNTIDCELLNQIPFFTPIRGNRHRFLFYIPNSRTKAFDQCPIVNMCNNFNTVCDYVDPFVMKIDEVKRTLKEIYSR